MESQLKDLLDENIQQKAFELSNLDNFIKLSEEELQKAKSQCDEIMNTSGNNIKEQMALALEDSKVATTQLINEAEGRLKELRDGSEAAIERISEELASEIISKISRGK